MQVAVTLKAGQENRVGVPGIVTILLDLGAASSVDMRVELAAGIAAEQFYGAKRGFKVKAAAGFQAVVLKSTVDCVVQLIASNSDIDVNYTDGAAVSATIVNTPLSVSNDRGTNAGVPLYVAGISTTLTPAAAAADNAAVAVTGASVATLLAINSNRVAARFSNIGTDPCAIGTGGMTWAKRVIVLNAGDTWNETDGANLAWYGITDAGKSASITTQEVTA